MSHQRDLLDSILILQFFLNTKSNEFQERQGVFIIGLGVFIAP